MTILGPATKVYANFPRYYHSVWSYKQEAPYRLRLNWSYVRGESGYIPGSPIPEANGIKAPGGFGFDIYLGSPVRSAALNRAYGSFRDQARAAISVAASVAERKQTIDMIAKRGMQILRFTRAMANFRWTEAGKVLGLNLETVRRRGKTRVYSFRDKAGDLREVKLKKGAKWLGNNYLEFHFGLEPLMKDIYEGLEILVTPVFQKRTIRSRATESYTPPSAAWQNYKVESRTTWKTGVAYVAEVVIDDPSAYTLNQLGVVNPASVAWEVIPFSFLADWVSSVGDVIGSLTDFLGMQIDNAAVTTRNEIKETEYYHYKTGGNNLIMPFRYVKWRSAKREIGLQGPVLAWKRIKLPSLTRAATAISLLTLALNPKQRNS